MLYLLVDHTEAEARQVELTSEADLPRYFDEDGFNLEKIDNGEVDIYRVEPDRGLCRAMVGPVEGEEGEEESEEDEIVALEIVDWEMVKRA